jgi:hypothetical protein
LDQHRRLAAVNKPTDRADRVRKANTSRSTARIIEAYLEPAGQVHLTHPNRVRIQVRTNSRLRRAA